MDSLPLTNTDFQTLLSRLPSCEGERVAVAVSGGPDSMALAFCLKRLCAAQNLVALIVEHGLRAESAQEAASVASRLRAMGIETDILPWVHDEVKSRIHVQAREARYGLLVEACQKRGIRSLFMAHHANDQAETILMRFAKGSGIDGLAGMADVTELEGVRLVRPLLDVPKARLIATCEANEVSYVTDPSNEAQKYARGRLRHVMPLLESEGFSLERLLDLGQRAREAKEALDHYATHLLRSSAESMAGGAVRLDLIALRGAPRAVAMRMVTMILMWIHQGDYPPERKHLVSLMDWLMDQDAQEAKTTYGCMVKKGEACAKVTFLREFGAVEGAVPLDAVQQENLSWDGRWHVTYTGPETDLVVAALGFQEHALLDRLSPRLRGQMPHGRIRACLPALWRGAELVAIPDFSMQDQGVVKALLLPPSWQ